MAAKTAKKKVAKKRELLTPAGDARYVRRDDKGEFKGVRSLQVAGCRSTVQVEDGCEARPR